ncbi:MAG: hypothetical protein EOP87_12115 [Verrucomicrobiaceae bacterium]|nr:MAG: hypothetical protein EOP87_12115 [Verrucomicrobiaceae bacterium]
MTSPPVDWESDKRVARSMLRNRGTRRKIMARMLWLVDGWLRERPWMFLIWWGACAFLTCMAMVMALYDMLAVIREEREKRH